MNLFFGNSGQTAPGATTNTTPSPSSSNRPRQAHLYLRIFQGYLVGLGYRYCASERQRQCVGGVHPPVHRFHQASHGNCEDRRCECPALCPRQLLPKARCTSSPNAPPTSSSLVAFLLLQSIHHTYNPSITTAHNKTYSHISLFCFCVHPPFPLLVPSCFLPFLGCTVDYTGYGSASLLLCPTLSLLHVVFFQVKDPMHNDTYTRQHSSDNIHTSSST
ncbi:hypothetical protein C8F01DRAFT_159306 [Mycena amicta]|nr:hypothetical protein C8F01DRAFT_159306 [Mycena amicta]